MWQIYVCSPPSQQLSNIGSRNQRFVLPLKFIELIEEGRIHYWGNRHCPPLHWLDAHRERIAYKELNQFLITESLLLHQTGFLSPHHTIGNTQWVHPGTSLSTSSQTRVWCRGQTLVDLAKIWLGHLSTGICTALSKTADMPLEDLQKKGDELPEASKTLQHAVHTIYETKDNYHHHEWANSVQKLWKKG